MSRTFIAACVATIALCIGLAITSDSEADTVSLVTSKPFAKVATLPTCSAATMGLTVIVGGDDNAGVNASGSSKTCICKGGGIGLDAGAAKNMDAEYAARLADTAIYDELAGMPFKWCSLDHTTGAAIDCFGGTPTVCP